MGELCTLALVEWPFAYEVAMSAKGVWGLAIAGLLALGGLIGAPIADSLVKEGKLPDWMSLKLAGFAGWLSTDVPIPMWSLVLILVCVCAVGTLFFKFLSRAPSGVDSRLAEATSLLEASHQRNYGLEESNSLLQQQLHEKSKALEALEANKLEVSAQGSKVLAIVALCTDRGARPTLSTIAAAMAIGHVEAHAAIDVLMQQKLLEKVTAVRSTYFRFTAKGREYYVKHKDQ